KTPLERDRRSMLRQSRLQDFVEDALGLGVVAAQSAMGEVLAKRGPGLGGKVPSQSFEIQFSRSGAVHALRAPCPSKGGIRRGSRAAPSARVRASTYRFPCAHR